MRNFSLFCIQTNRKNRRKKAVEKISSENELYNIALKHSNSCEIDFLLTFSRKYMVQK